MKYILILTFVFCSISCSQNTYNFESKIDYIDYTYFKEKDIFITEATSVNFEYETLGSLSVTEYSGYITIAKKNSNKRIIADNLYQENYNDKSSKELQHADIDRIYESVYNEVVKVGGNGILNFKINYIPPVKDKYKILQGKGFIVSGMIIKRESR